MTKFSAADARADARRTYRWQSTASGLLAVAVIALAIRELGTADIEPNKRLFLLLLPLPALAWAVWEQIAHYRRLDEFQRALNARALEITWPLALAWIALVALLSAAFGFPVPLPAPFGLPADELDVVMILLVPLILHMVAFVIVHKRYLGKQ